MKNKQKLKTNYCMVLGINDFMSNVYDFRYVYRRIYAQISTKDWQAIYWGLVIEVQQC